jgi:hypothetical protein
MAAPPPAVEPRELEPGIYSFKELCRWLQQSGVLAIWLQRIGIPPGCLRDYLNLLKKFEQDDNTEDAFKAICLLMKRRAKPLDFRNACVFILVGLLRTFFSAQAASVMKKLNIHENPKYQTDFHELKWRLARTEKNAKSLTELLRLRKRGNVEITRILSRTPPEIRSSVVPRSDKDGSRPRKLFCWRLGTGIRKATGKPCHEQVRIFAQAAFPELDITLDQVRGPWRPTTKKGRSRKNRYIHSKTSAP